MELENYRLAVKPRKLSLFTWSHMLLGGEASIQWFLLGILLALSSAFVRYSDLAYWCFFFMPATTTSASVTRTEPTDRTDSKGQVTTLYYSFTADRKVYKSVAHSSDVNQLRCESMTVEYISVLPSISRLRGTQSAYFPWFVGMFPLLLLVCWSIYMIMDFLRRLKQIWLLQHGEAVIGRLRNRSIYCTNGPPATRAYYIYSIIYRDNEKAAHRLALITRKCPDIKRGDPILVLYDTNNPELATAPQLLPGSPKCDSSGIVQTNNPLHAAVFFLFAVSIIIGVIAWNLILANSSPPGQ